ncbi:SU10 major capsid protein [Lysinibacillus xylanilyticus]|uniref:SU10 major capsid protein n=1 Tax=Lysinibacillus xylanilyticus TaxID=582475 RepID=UPI0038046CC0
MITSTNGFTATESISLSKELALLGVQQTPFTSLLLSKGVEKALSTIHTWKEKTLATDGETDSVEGADTVTFQQSSKREISNILQIFKRAVSISGTAQAMQSGKFNEEVADRLLELKIKLESVLINGLKKDGSKTPFIRQMSGVIEFGDASNNVAVTGAITESDIKTAMRNLWNQNLAEGQVYALINADLKEQVDAIYKDRYGYQHVTTSFGLLVDEINTNYGSVKFILSKHTPADKVVFVNDAYVNMIALREAHYENLAKTGDNTKGHVVGEYSLMVGSPKAVAVLTVTQ